MQDLVREEQPYNNRQIERLLDKQSADLKEHMDLLLNPILEQTKKTNGRVTTLEGHAAIEGKKVERMSTIMWVERLVFGGIWSLILVVITVVLGKWTP